MRHTKRGGWPYSQPPNVQFEINRASPQAKGLVAWWPTLGSRGATLLRDFSGHGYHGTFVGAGEPAWVNDAELGYALDFDGANDYITVSHDGHLENFTRLSVSAWVNLNTLTSGGVVGDWNASGNHGGWLLYYDSVGAKFYFDIINEAAGEKTVWFANPTAGAWYHLLGTYDGSNIRLYVNGILQGAIAQTGKTFDSDNAVWIGRYYGYEIDALITDVHAHSCVLSGAEAWHIYNRETRWELYKPLVRRWIGWESPITARMPRYGFTNFQVPGIV